MAKPLYDRIVVRVEDDEQEQTTASGIVVTTSQDPNAPKEGVVVATGEGRLLPDGRAG